MKYLNVITLKIFLCLLYGNESITIPVSQYTDSEKFIRDISKYKIQTFFSLIRNNKFINDIDYKNFLDEDYLDYYLRSYPLKIILHKKDIKNLNDFIIKYINNFESDYLNSYTDHYFSFIESVSKTVKVLKDFERGIEKESSIKIPFKENFENIFYKKEVRFYETIFYLDKGKIVSINSCKILESKSKEKQKIDLRFTVKKDISSVSILKESFEEQKKINAKIVLEISYDDFSRTIYINGYKIVALQYYKPNRVIFEYLFKHHDEYIEREKLKEKVLEELGKPLKKSLTKFVNDIGFQGKRRELFFTTTKDAIKLRIKITKEQLDAANIRLSEILL